jgi:hypothetical protein
MYFICVHTVILFFYSHLCWSFCEIVGCKVSKWENHNTANFMLECFLWDSCLPYCSCHQVNIFFNTLSTARAPFLPWVAARRPLPTSTTPCTGMLNIYYHTLPNVMYVAFLSRQPSDTHNICMIYIIYTLSKLYLLSNEYYLSNNTEAIQVQS